MFFPFTKIESVFALFSSYVLSKPYADWAEKYRKKSQSDTHFRTVGKICFPNAVIVAGRFHVIRQASWAMEQVRKNEQNKLSRGLRRYFKRSKHLLRKPMEALSSEEQECLALMVEIAPRLADAYRLKNEFLAVMHSESSTVGKQRLLDWLAAVNVIVFFTSTPTIDIEPEITEISPLRTFLGDFLISVHSITAVSLAIMIIEKSKEVWLMPGLVCQIFIVSGALLIPQHGYGVGFGGMGLGKRPDQRQPIKIRPGHPKIEIPVSGHGVI